jgi:hypothetical protein
VKTLARIVLVLITAVAGFYFSYWMGGALLLGLKAPEWAQSSGSPILAAVVAIAAAWFVWSHTAGPGGLLTAMGMGAVVTGAIGFIVGFFGPLHFTPEANQGPLLGLFITGPLAFVLGGIGGAAYWLVRGRRVRPAAGSDPRSA